MKCEKFCFAWGWKRSYSLSLWNLIFLNFFSILSFLSFLFLDSCCLKIPIFFSEWLHVAYRRLLIAGFSWFSWLFPHVVKNIRDTIGKNRIAMKCSDNYFVIRAAVHARGFFTFFHPFHHLQYAVLLKDVGHFFSPVFFNSFWDITERLLCFIIVLHLWLLMTNEIWVIH